MNDREIILLAVDVIPLRSCPQDRSNDIKRRAYLVKKIKELIERELSKQFNAKEV